MNTDVEHLICEVLLGFQKEGRTLLKLDLESLHRVHVNQAGGLLDNFFPKQLCEL